MGDRLSVDRHDWPVDDRFASSPLLTRSPHHPVTLVNENEAANAPVSAWDEELRRTAFQKKAVSRLRPN